ncbi:hypothetical protein N9053_02695, partial [bacterium]|nr:hypothetical protein [bacterium]
MTHLEDGMVKKLGRLMLDYFQNEVEAGAEYKCRYVIHSIEGKYLDYMLSELKGKGVSIDVNGRTISTPFL